MHATILNISYSACGGAFLFLGLLISLNWRRSSYAIVLLTATMLTAAWAIGVILSQVYTLPTFLLAVLEIGRTASWLAFLGLILGISQIQKGLMNAAFATLLLSIIIAPILGVYAVTIFHPGFLLPETVLLIVGLCYMSLATLGLLLLENIYRNADDDGRWSLKFLCFGLGALFSYDFLYYADIVLFRALNDSLFLARGFVNALAVPLLAISMFRTRSWSLDLHISRNVVLHTAALLIGGLYLLVMAGAGYFVQRYGGTWGTVIQITFFFAAFLALIVLISSGSLRTKVRLFISRNFYSTKYDYRTEWSRFVQTVSSGTTIAPLPDRILHAFSQIVASTSAALWVLGPGEKKFVLAAQWNMGKSLPDETLPSPLIQILEQERSVMEVGALKQKQSVLMTSDLAAWLRDEKRAWLILPLMHRQSVQAVLVLGTPRAQRHIDWEDQELLMTVGRQAASYLAEEKATHALSEARQFEAFSKRSAFVAHDIKNIVNQLSLMVKNSESHGAKPEFQSDMLETIESAVTRMTALLQQLGDWETASPSTIHPLDLNTCLMQVKEHWRHASTGITFELTPGRTLILGDPEQLISSFNHLIQNAIDATQESGISAAVVVRTRRQKSSVTVDVIDQGPGMDAAFMQEKLFKPLSSTKKAGFGLGVYQVREYIELIGGTLEVESSPGKGTTMRVSMPLAGAAPEARAGSTTGAEA